MRINSFFLAGVLTLILIKPSLGAEEMETIAGQAEASVTSEESQPSAPLAPEVINELTPIGAERVGNSEGTIPEWTGGLTKPPAGYKVGDHHPDPYSADKIQFTITGKNVDQYSSKLSAGQIALLKKYSTYKLPVYATKRSAAYPQRIYDAIKANKDRAKLVDNGNGVSGAVIGIPFPNPKNGQEAIWNHLLRYRGEAIKRNTNEAVVNASGQYWLRRAVEHLLFPYAQKNMTLAKLKNIVLYFKQQFTSPVRDAGMLTMTHDTINQVREKRHSWIYNPGVRRVMRAPYIAYDNPATDLRVIDQFDMFNGGIDRYDWTLVGKQELYVPYNAYKLHSGDLKYTDIIKPQHINADLTRYELHRVWKVEAKLKNGASHIFAKRTFYLDEDSWQALIIDHYDNRGEIWRVMEGHVINYYEMPLIWTTLISIYDLQSRRYGVMGLNNEEAKDINFGINLTTADFTPAALRSAVKR